ncbi:hypothetical protein FGB62_227g03 [Gracilaria domingensis]|nr:hypothetical protein FGB62_227g03 [Gracilaria domingensis]
MAFSVSLTAAQAVSSRLAMQRLKEFLRRTSELSCLFAERSVNGCGSGWCGSNGGGRGAAGGGGGGAAGTASNGARAGGEAAGAGCGWKAARRRRGARCERAGRAGDLRGAGGDEVRRAATGAGANASIAAGCGAVEEGAGGGVGGERGRCAWRTRSAGREGHARVKSGAERRGVRRGARARVAQIFGDFCGA